MCSSEEKISNKANWKSCYKGTKFIWILKNGYVEGNRKIFLEKNEQNSKGGKNKKKTECLWPLGLLLADGVSPACWGLPGSSQRPSMCSDFRQNGHWGGGEGMLLLEGTVGRSPGGR